MIWNVANKTINSIWPMLVIFLVVIITTRITYIMTHKEKFCFYKEFWTLFFICYILLLFQLVTSTDISNNGGINYIPFTEIFRYEIGSKLFMLNVIGNIAMFIPFGYFISHYLNAKKISSIFIVTLIASACIEIVQLNIGRSFDIDDIILNCIGSIVGFLIYIALGAIKRHLPKFLQSDFFYNIICLLILIAVVLYFKGYINLGALI
ncbi:MAG: VanZ family protein [Bacilli bacterium]|nr:VanZ family protein [Bacilli bacterium]MBQ9834547.1 VanZ family protein [Bacilli bacterium]